MKNKIIKKAIFLPTIFLPVMCMYSCAIAPTPVTPETEQKFLGFKDNSLTYSFSTDTKPIEKSVPIVQISNNFYRTSEPLELFTRTSLSESYTFKFELLVANDNVSKRCRFFTDSSEKVHSISLLSPQNQYIDKMPTFNVFDAKNVYDTIYVNLECNQNIFLQVDCRIWDNPAPNDLSFDHERTSIEDKHVVSFNTPLRRYECTILCNSFGYKEDITTTFSIVCKPKSIYEYSNLFFNIVKDEGTGQFEGCCSMNISYKKVQKDNDISYLVEISYTFMKGCTPTKEEYEGATPVVYHINAYNINESEPEEQQKVLMSSCFFKILWI